MAKSTLTHVPFDGDGSLRSHTYAKLGVDYVVAPRNGVSDRWSRSASTIWRPATPFFANLTLDRLERGRSAATFIWKDDLTDAEYPMFGQWLVDAIKKGVMIKGKALGEWGFAKRGANYSIELIQMR